jgi:nicotinamide mononucleotide adenylyltransferase
MSEDPFTQACLEGAVTLLEDSIAERLKQLEKWIGLVCAQLKDAEERDGWIHLPDRVRERLEVSAQSDHLSQLVNALNGAEIPYTKRIQALTADQQGIVQQFFEQEIQRFTALAVEEPGENYG